MVFIVALYVLGVGVLRPCPRLILCSTLIILSVAQCIRGPYSVLLGSRFSMSRAVGQDVSPGKCVLLGTFKAVWQSMKLWDVSGDGEPWFVELDVWDLGGRLDFTRRAGAGSLSGRVKDATHEVAAVGALPLGGSG